MKLIRQGLCSLLCIFTATILFAQKKEKYEFVKEKSISKTYPASGNKLWINNSFGSVKYIVTSGNEIKVDVRIEVSSDKQDRAQELIDQITVTDQQKGSDIEFKTDINSNKNKNQYCNNCKTSMQINYEVKLPSSVPLHSSNSFGNTELPDYPGPVWLTSKFGDLSTGALSNLKDINMEFGKVSIKSVANLDASFKFSQVSIANLSGSNKIKLEFCDDTRITLDNSLTSLNLKESYSTVGLKPGSGLSASYTIKTSFGTVVDRTGTGIKRTDTPDRYGPDSDKTYEGGSGNTKVDVKSSFGRIIIGELTAEDVKKKEKNKTKNGSVSL